MTTSQQNRAVDPGWSTLPTRYPWLLTAFAAIIVIACIFLIGTTTTSGSLGGMLPTHDSSSAALARVTEAFDISSDVTLLVTQPEKKPPNQEVLVSFAERFSHEMDHPRANGGQYPCRITHTWLDGMEEWVREVVAPYLLFYLSPEQREELRERLTPAGMREQFRLNERAVTAPGLAGMAAAKLLEDPLRIREFVQSAFASDTTARGVRPGQPMFSAENRSLLIHITPLTTIDGSQPTRDFMDQVRGAIRAADPGELTVDIAGGIAIAEAAERAIRSDMMTSSIGTVLLLQMLFLMTYRRVFLFPIVLIPAATGIVVGFGVFALTGRALSPPTAVIGAMLAGLGVDYSIHYLSHCRNGQTLGETSRLLARPMLMACVTSMIAFLAISQSDVAALRDFALIGMCGLAATLIATLSLQPALLTLIAKRRGLTPSKIAQPRWHMNALLYTVARHKRAGITASVIASLLAVIVLVLHPQGPLVFDNQLSNMHPQPNAPLEAQNEISSRYAGGGDMLLLYLRADSEDELIRRAHECRQRLLAHASDYVPSTMGIDLLLPTGEQRQAGHAFAQGLDTARILADYDAAVEQSIFDPEKLFDYRNFLQEMLQPDDKSSLTTASEHSTIIARFLPRCDTSPPARAGNYKAISHLFLDHPLDQRSERAEAIAAIRKALQGIPGVTLTGMPVVGHDVETMVRHDLFWLLQLAAAAVIAWLGVCFRNFKDVAAALLPVTMGLLITFAAMLLTGVHLNLINLIALPLLAGLGVDDGIFFVAVTRNARIRRLDAKQLIHELASSTQAVFLTSATSMLAFGSLMLTSVPAIRSLGAVMAIGITACLLATVFALAPILIWSYTNSRSGPPSRESMT